MNPAVTVVRDHPFPLQLDAATRPDLPSSQSLAVFRGFPWRMVRLMAVLTLSLTLLSSRLSPFAQVPRYILAQVFGAFCGALIVYGKYVELPRFDHRL